MPNLYCSLEDFKRSDAVSGSSKEVSETKLSDPRIIQLIEAVCREIDKWCFRHFYSRTETLLFSAEDSLVVYLPADLIAVTTLKEDTNWDSIYETTWAATGYVLWPYNAKPTLNIDRAKPYRRLEVNFRNNSSRHRFLMGQLRYELAGKWGYSECVEVVDAINDAAGISASVTTVTVDNPDLFSIGDMIMINSEQIYIADKLGAILTIERAQNGTTAAIHADDDVISRIMFPTPIREAAIMQAGRLYSRRMSGFAQEMGFDQAGGMTPVSGWDRDVQQMLNPYKRKII